MSNRPDSERIEFAWQQINGFSGPGTQDGVTDRSGPDGDIDRALGRLYEARDRLCARLNADPARDRDADELLSAAEDLARACGGHMYRQGWADACRCPPDFPFSQ